MSLNRVDVHHHFVPNFYKDAVITSGGDPSGWQVPAWDLKIDAAVNKKFQIGKTILSLTAPGACILKDPQAAADLARKTNELAAQIRDEKPKEYGFFAALPNILDTELALKEIAYAYDVLKADGVTLFTRYGAGNAYLGHPDLKPVWAELNRRSAVILVHPTHPIDISQTALDMIYNKTVKNNPNCKIILSHAGGTLPYLIGRPTSIFCKTDAEVQEFEQQARDLYYDVAVAGTENVLKILETFAKPDHILYGSDTPYARDGIIDFHTSRFDKFEFADPTLRDAINRGNALKLWPRLNTR
ncbi:hypothetical protein SCUCBS95973_004096 [Sporothrix curviconia]|uniref:6-methylsalicylate decarboxylase n=1 Tax=Sporothrix curviconia TaxID=1260050 RepID=A0ABP0BKT9_9PEZI